MSDKMQTGVSGGDNFDWLHLVSTHCQIHDPDLWLGIYRVLTSCHRTMLEPWNDGE